MTTVRRLSLDRRLTLESSEEFGSTLRSGLNRAVPPFSLHEGVGTAQSHPHPMLNEMPRFARAAFL